MLLLCYASAIRFELLTPKIPSNDPYYALTFDIYPELARQCAAHPGVTLASPDDGDYIRYHTPCAIIANNFLLTPLHERKIREVRDLMNQPAEELLEAGSSNCATSNVRRDTLFRGNARGGLDYRPGGYPEIPDLPLVRELIEAPADRLPPRFRLVKELAFSDQRVCRMPACSRSTRPLRSP